MYCIILSSSKGYFVMRCVTSRIHSGTSLLLTRELLLCCCDMSKGEDYLFSPNILPHNSTKQHLRIRAYSDKGLKFLVLLLQLFEDINSLDVVTAKLAIRLLHLLSVFIRKLKKKNKNEYR